MSLYKDASLVMIPSAYKDGKLYSIRPVPEYGAELVTNGTFDTDSGWNKGSGWTISGGKANASSATSDFTQTISFTLGKTYRISYTISNYSSGSVRTLLGAYIAGATRSSNGTYIEDIRPTNASSNSLLYFEGISGFSGSIDNVSVQEIVSSGDFTFSRGSNLAATRVDVNGLIEKGRENHILHSNAITTSPWGGPRIFSQTQGHTGYDGSNDAWLMIPNSTSGTHYKVQSVSPPNGVTTISVYAKAAGYNYMSIRDDSSGNSYARFDLATGVTSITGSNAITSKIESVGNDWWRCSLTYQETATGNILFYVNNAYDYAGVYAGDEVSGVYFQDFQLEQGMVASDVISTTTTSVSAGILEDMPRLDYSGGASCPSLLLEPQRLNLVSQSEYMQYSNNINVSVNDNETTSPEGVVNAAQVIPNSTNSNHIVRSNNLAGLTSQGTYSVSVFAKQNGYKYINLGAGFGSTATPLPTFDLNTGTIVSNSSNGTIEDYGNGWYKCTAIIQIASTALYPIISILNNSQSGSYVGDGTSAVYLYGHQIEQGSYPTSYIPTYGTSQTRSVESTNNMDVGSYLGSDWTAFYDIPEFTQERVLYDGINLSCSSNGLVIRTWSANGNGIVVEAKNGGITGNNHIIYRSNPTGAKIALRKIGDVVSIYADASFVGNLSLANNTGDDFDRLIMLAGNPYSLSQVLLFPTALTDSECIALTTL